MKNKSMYSNKLIKKRRSSNKIIEDRWKNDHSRGSSGFIEYYKTKGPKFNPIPFCGGSPGLGKRK